MNNGSDQPNKYTRSEKIREVIMKHQLTALLVGTIIIALICSAIGLMLYNTSGTAQIDLSRPDYAGVKPLTDNKGDAIEYIDYPANGPINDESLREFDRLYKAQMQNIATDAFGGDPLALDSLRIDEVNTQE